MTEKNPDRPDRIGIGGRVTSLPLPHHRTCGSAYGGSVRLSRHIQQSRKAERVEVSNRKSQRPSRAVGEAPWNCRGLSRKVRSVVSLTQPSTVLGSASMAYRSRIASCAGSIPPTVAAPRVSGSSRSNSSNHVGSWPVVSHRRPLHLVLVQRLALLLHASFRPRLATRPLRFPGPSPPPGWTGDFHPQAVEHVRHTPERTRPRATRPLLLPTQPYCPPPAPIPAAAGTVLCDFSNCSRFSRRSAPERFVG